MQAPIAESTALQSDRPHELMQGGIPPGRLVSDGHAAIRSRIIEAQALFEAAVGNQDTAVRLSFG
jgi:hypothetical protein